jgi:hypothetical protein
MSQHLRVNDTYLGVALSPFSPLEESDQDDLAAVDTNNEEATRSAIRERVRPVFDSYDVERKQIVENTLRHHLTMTEGPDAQVPYSPMSIEAVFSPAYDLLLPVIQRPSDLRQFFLWLWKELFGSEDYHMVPGDAYELDDKYP